MIALLIILGNHPLSPNSNIFEF